jgi:hypothetical protein
LSTQEEEALWDDDSRAMDRTGSGTRRDGYKSESGEESKPGNLMKKNWSNKGPVKMKCSWKQFVAMLENLLVFCSMYKCSAPRFRPDSSPVMPMNCFLLSATWWLGSLPAALMRRDTNGSSRSCTRFFTLLS